MAAWRILLGMALLLAASLSSAGAEKRVALVIGNANYSSLSVLNNPTGDAAAVGEALRERGFEIILGHDLDRAAFLDTLETFREAADGADLAVVYYAGHGMEIDGKNIVAPVDMEVSCETKKAKRSVSLDQLFASVSAARNQVVLLDSCRNDPFPNCPTKSARAGSGFRGIDRVDTPEGTLLFANATLSGQLAEDGPAGAHSPFAAALLKRVKDSGHRFIYETLNAVAGDVRAATKGGQIPEVVARGGLPEICFGECKAVGDSGGGEAIVTPPRDPQLQKQIDELKKQLALATEKPKSAQPTPAIPAVPAGKTLQDVRARGALNCGVSKGFAGFSAPDDKGNWSGIDVDVCRGIAAAVLGDAQAIKFVPLSSKDRFTALQAHEIDVLVRNTTWTASRENDLGLRFAGPNLYDGTGLMVRKSLGVARADDLAGAAICVQAGTTTELEVRQYFEARKIDVQAITLDSFQQVQDAYDSGRCDALANDATALYAVRLSLASPEDHAVLPERLTAVQLGPYVRNDDEQWLNIVRSVLHALVWAEERGITAANIDEMQSSPNLEVRRLAGTEDDFGKVLGLSGDWARAVIKAVGNYGEVFERNLGSGSPLRMDRGQNNLISAGGQMSAPVLR